MCKSGYPCNIDKIPNWVFISTIGIVIWGIFFLLYEKNIPLGETQIIVIEEIGEHSSYVRVKNLDTGNFSTFWKTDVDLEIKLRYLKRGDVIILHREEKIKGIWPLQSSYIHYVNVKEDINTFLENKNK